jgi:hypothetical protein
MLLAIAEVLYTYFMSCIIHALFFSKEEKVHQVTKLGKIIRIALAIFLLIVCLFLMIYFTGV